MGKTLFEKLILLFLIFLSTSQAQWKKIIMPSSRGGGVYSVCIKDSNIFVGMDAGVYLSKDNCLHWVNVNPDLPPRERSPKAVSLASNSKNIITAFREPNVYLSSDNGTNWSMAGINGGLRSTPTVIATNGNWIIGGYPGGNYQSRDNGKSWMQTSNLPPIVSAALQDSIALAATYSGIYRSTDYGSSWIKVHSFFSTSGSGQILASGIYAYAGGSNYGGSNYLFYSKDKGLTWRDSALLHCNSINSIVLSPEASGNNYLFAGTDSGVFRSSDNGINWAAVNNGLTSKLIFSLAFKVTGTGGTSVLYAGSGGGLFCSSDYGVTWNISGSPAEWQFASNGTDLYAASSNNSYQGDSWFDASNDYDFYSLVYHSKDNGLNWNQVYAGFLDRNSQITSLSTINTGNGYYLIAGARWAKPRIGAYHGIVFTSGSNGLNWTTAYCDSTGGNHILIQGNSAYIYLFINQLNSWGLERSKDNGITWEKPDSALTITVAYQIKDVNPWINTLSMDGNRMYAGGGGSLITFPPRPVPPFTAYCNYIMESIDNGNSWEKINSQLDSGKVIKNPEIDTISTIAALYTAGSHLLVGMNSLNFYYSPYDHRVANGGGFYHLVHQDSTWTVVDSAFKGKSVFGFAAYNSNIYAATESGVFHTTNYGRNWDDISSGMDDINVSSLFVSGSYLLASTSNGPWARPLSEITSAVEYISGDKKVPEKYSLSQNYPNPFNPETTIKFSIPQNEFVSLKIFNILGEEVATLISKSLNAGTYAAYWQASRFASGIYFYRIQAGSYSETKKLVFIK